MYRVLKAFLLSFLFLLTSCGLEEQREIRIGIDPYFYPNNFEEKEGDLNAFIDELLQMIAKEEDVAFSLFRTNWDSIYQGLENGNFEGVFTSLSPNTYKKYLYSFSNPLLMTGPVLIVEEGSEITSLNDLNGKMIVMVEGYSGINEVQKHPHVIVKTTFNIPDALNQVKNKKANAALIPNVFAQSYLENLYPGMLKIAGSPMTEDGVYLGVMKDKNQELVNLFNRAYQKLEKEGKIAALKEKWAL